MNLATSSVPVALHVWGDYACFTRPEMKVERVSYDVMTPAAARGILEAILWKPAIRWCVHSIEVLKPIRWTTVRRNELGAVIATGTVASAMKTNSGNIGLYIEEERQQRAGLLLRDVQYLIRASFVMTERAGVGDSTAKFYEMFRRRAEKGQCFNQPYLGCREFSGYFEFVDESSCFTPIQESKDLGWMLFDICFDGSEPMPSFFRGRLENGVMSVPAFDSEEVRR